MCASVSVRVTSYERQNEELFGYTVCACERICCRDFQCCSYEARSFANRTFVGSLVEYTTNWPAQHPKGSSTEVGYMSKSETS